MSYLVDLLKAATAGQGSLILISGESGVGKSRLLEELRIWALVEGILVLRGQAVSDGRGYYQLWRDVLRSILLYVQPGQDELALLQPVVPDLARLLNPPTMETDPTGPQRMLALALQAKVDEYIRRHDCERNENGHDLVLLLLLLTSCSLPASRNSLLHR
jgi:ABC-type iron transport system FetAB ATPase subunit